MIANEPTGRIDTTITMVAVRRGDSTTATAAARRYILDNFADEQPNILAIWSANQRDQHANPVFEVEWENGNGDPS